MACEGNDHCQHYMQVPGIAAAAVVGLPHDRLGEQVHSLPMRDSLIACHVCHGKSLISHDSCGSLYRDIVTEWICMQVSALLSLNRDVAWSEDGEFAEANMQQLSTGKHARLSPRVVREACKQRGLSSFMVPRVVLAQYAPLPTNSSGKLLKHAVREMMLARLHQSGPASRI